MLAFVALLLSGISRAETISGQHPPECISRAIAWAVPALGFWRMSTLNELPRSHR
jgi:hypothetical protein